MRYIRRALAVYFTNYTWLLVLLLFVCWAGTFLPTSKYDTLFYYFTVIIPLLVMTTLSSSPQEVHDYDIGMGAQRWELFFTNLLTTIIFSLPFVTLSFFYHNVLEVSGWWLFYLGGTSVITILGFLDSALSRKRAQIFLVIYIFVPLLLLIIFQIFGGALYLLENIIRFPAILLPLPLTIPLLMYLSGNSKNRICKKEIYIYFGMLWIFMLLGFFLISQL